MSQRETDHTDEGKSGSDKDDFVDLPDLTVPCSGVLPEDMQAVTKHQVNSKINEDEQSISELDKVNEENENKQKRISELEEKLKEAERNTREFNLWLHGLQEHKGEDLKKRVFDICCSVAPEAAPDFYKHIDIVLRVGKKTEGKIRPVIMSFTERSTMELLLTASYSSEYHRSCPLKFKDVLTAKEIDTRNKLWPRIEAARKKKITAFFIGAKAIIDGEEISE